LALAADAEVGEECSQERLEDCDAAEHDALAAQGPAVHFVFGGVFEPLAHQHRGTRAGLLGDEGADEDTRLHVRGNASPDGVGTDVDDGWLFVGAAGCSFEASSRGSGRGSGNIKPPTFRMSK
jgi:hypothetical protein